MSILTEEPAEFLVVDGVPYTIRTDFRVWLAIGEIFRDEGLSPQQKLVRALSLCYSREALPPTVSDAVGGMLDFYRGAARKDGARGGEQREPVLDFSQDAPLLYAAFLTQYGIDLSRDSLHWHRFRALLSGLSPEHRICQVMGYRSVDLSTISDKKKKAFYRKMKRLYAISKEQDVAAALSELF
ncbi:MAG: bacteriophage Gp15 family protein [Clostridia bacterium]|nr:bacteriophage Gp15 family protein [Clostridia bacterium]